MKKKKLNRAFFMPFVPLNLIKDEIQVLHDRVVAYQNLKTKVYTATRPARRFRGAYGRWAFAYKSF